MSISFRWLGAAGIELETSGEVLLVDPYLTRIPLWKTLFGRIQPDMSAVQSIEKCDYILVTHSHFDHLLDVPPIVLKTGAIVYRLVQHTPAAGFTRRYPDLIQTVHLGDRLCARRVRVSECFPSNTTASPDSTPDALPRVLSSASQGAGLPHGFRLLLPYYSGRHEVFNRPRD